MKQNDGHIVENEENGRYKRVRDITTVPAATRINGQKAITVKGEWAYVQRVNGMTIYRFNRNGGYWDAFKTVLAINY